MGRSGVTLADVARQAGVSKMAVSVVLTGRHADRIGVSEQTRGRILAAAREMHYRPNAVARSLVRRATDVLGYYSSWEIDARHTFDAEVVGGLLRGCHQHRKNLLLFDGFSVRNEDKAQPGQPGAEVEPHADVTDGKIDGLVLRCLPGDPVFRRLEGTGLPVVALADAHPGVPSVVLDDEGGARLMARHLHEKGHRRVMFRGQPDALTSKLRRRAFHGEAAALGMEVWEDPDSRYDPMSDREKEMLSPGTAGRPTAVACWSDSAAEWTLFHCDRAGLSVPGDVAVIGFNGFVASGAPPARRLTTIRAPWFELSRAAVSSLIDQIDGRDVEPLTVLPLALVEGDTT